MKITAMILATFLGFTASRPQPFFFEVPIDHKNRSMGMYRMQYIVDDQYFHGIEDGDNNGPVDKPNPIFFYPGNEGSVWDFYKNSGFMTTTLAETYGALVVFAEHRYFGQSWPFKKEYAFNETYNSYLTVEQTMADYVELLDYIKVKYNAPKKATIAFGGSYGGMLAAWMRMKYPHVIQGSLAASAPVLMFKNVAGVQDYGFAEIASNDFNISGEINDTCYQGMNKAFTTILTGASIPNFTDTVAKSFNTCQKLEYNENITSLADSLRNGFFYMAMTDYPQAAAFLEPMPANPINVSCEAFKNYTDDTTVPELMDMLQNAAKVYFNWENRTDFCYDIANTEASGTLAAGGWDVLACNELVLTTTNGLANNSIFTATDDIFDFTQYKDDCRNKYALNPQVNWATRQFGGKYNYSQEFRQYSNIIFSNGIRDPWRAGGVVDYVSPTVPVYMIQDGAHHSDLRLPLDSDPESLKWVRAQETEIIGKWIHDYQPKQQIGSKAKFLADPIIMQD